MALDLEFLLALSEAPAVATACGPVLSIVRSWLGDQAVLHLCPDSHALVLRPAARLDQVETLLVAHMDEVGGVVLGEANGGGYYVQHWGCSADRFATASLQGMDYLARTSAEAFPVDAAPTPDGSAGSFLLHGAGIRPFRTVWTFQGKASISGDFVMGKALDPRATLFAVLAAFAEMGDPVVAVLMVMAEECAMDVAQKAVRLLQRQAPGLRRIVNADVPDVTNLIGGRLDRPAIRIFEGRNMVDPSFGIRLAENITDVDFQLTASLTGSQTPLFRPLAPTVSVALPGEGVHTPQTRMSLTGIQRCVDLLCRIATAGVSDDE